jgi:hypothetical protein
MALQYDRVAQVADAFVAVSNRMVALLTDINQLLEHNSDQAIDWGASETPAYINEEANGNLSGRMFSRQQVSNAIGSLDWVRKLLTNQAMTGSQGDHLGNLNQLAGPLP